MTQAYPTEDQKLVQFDFPEWTISEGLLMHTILLEKGYLMNHVSRRGYDGKQKEAWQVLRRDVPQLVEQCFRQRLTVEVQAEGHGKAAIIFGHGYAAETVIDAVKRFQKNKEVPV